MLLWGGRVWNYFLELLELYWNYVKLFRTIRMFSLNTGFLLFQTFRYIEHAVLTHNVTIKIDCTLMQCCAGFRRSRVWSWSCERCTSTRSAPKWSWSRTRQRSQSLTTSGQHSQTMSGSRLRSSSRISFLLITARKTSEFFNRSIQAN